MIDIHSHILPGVDDGARTLTESVEIVRVLTKMGVTDIVATPHFIAESNYESSRYDNMRKLMELKKALETEAINVKIYLGNEIYIDRRIKDLLKAGKIATLAESKYLLVEIPLNDEYANYEDILMDLMNCGYKVVLAHPERYAIIEKDFEIARELYRNGVLFQCNLYSILGKYGRNAKKAIRKLAKEKLIFTFGSDIHHPGDVEKMKKQHSLAIKKYLKYYNEAELKKLLVGNPAKIIGG